MPPRPATRSEKRATEHNSQRAGHTAKAANALLPSLPRMVVSARQRVQMLVPSALVRPYGFRCEGCPRKRVRLSDCRAHSPGHSDGEAGRQCARSITLHTAELRRPRQMPTESRTPLWPRKAAGEARSTEQTSWNRIFRRMDGEEMPKSRNALKTYEPPTTTDHHTTLGNPLYGTNRKV